MKILKIVGARPNFMKIAPLMAAAAEHEDIESVLVHTGQHHDTNLSRVFLEELGIPSPDVNLGIHGGSRESQIERIIDAFEPVLTRYAPDLVIVVGDVNSTVACARVSTRHGVPIAHVEAGLRSFDMDMPEERNRIEVDGLSDLLFVTEPSGMVNLDNEGIGGDKYLVGNVMIDTLAKNLPKAQASDVLERLGVTASGYFVATFHRPSNVDLRDSLEGLIERVQLICRFGCLVLPLHPRTANSLKAHGLMERFVATEGLVLTDPLGYHDFLKLVHDSRGVITDSGGIQEETTFLGIPCVTMRENTERPITITQGTNELVGSDSAKLADCLDRIVSGQWKSGRVPDLWDGQAAVRIIQTIHRELPATRI